MQKLFEFAILLHPTPPKDGPAPKSTLVVEPTRVLATDDKAAAMLAARAIPSTYEDQLEQLEVIVRPF